jgi:hypothetical protein
MIVGTLLVIIIIIYLSTMLISAVLWLYYGNKLYLQLKSENPSEAHRIRFENTFEFRPIKYVLKIDRQQDSEEIIKYKKKIKKMLRFIIKSTIGFVVLTLLIFGITLIVGIINDSITINM